MIKFSYAKINLSLNVLNKSKPEKMHELDMINMSISLHDTIKFKFDNNGNEITINCNNKDIPCDENNLIYKVIEKYKRVFHLQFSCFVELNKVIPSEAGLGGGSSNASSTLDALDKHFKTNMSVAQKMKFIEEITSDGPFMFVNGIARVKGTGNKVFPFKSKFNHKVVIVKPKYGFSTKEVYGNINYKTISHPNNNKIEEALVNNNFDIIANEASNSLYDVCKTIKPDITKIIDDLKELGFDIVLMSGSGSAIFAISKNSLPYKRFKKEFDKSNYQFYGIYSIRKGNYL